MLLGRIEGLGHFLEEKFKWREWKYIFKLVSSKVVSIVNLIEIVQEGVQREVKAKNKYTFN